MLAATAFECTNFAIKQDIPLQIWDAHTTLTVAGIPTLLLRTLHNKLVYYIINYTQCYVHYFSPRVFIYNLGLLKTLVLASFLYFIYKKSPKKIKRLIIFAVALYPIIMTFELYRYVS